jgi:threonine/homoserine/homoserine lactone efflux protein
MIEPTQWYFFLIATLALLIVPGPAVLYIVARSVNQGRLAGLVSVLGIASGTLFHVMAAALGLSAVLVSSALAFNVVKYIGAAYLIYLGIRKILAQDETGPSELNASESLRRIYTQGIVVNLLNPKTALFFFAFLPQFVNTSAGNYTSQILMLGIIFVFMATLTDGAYAFLASSLANRLKSSVHFLKGQRYFTGAVYVGLGLTTALTGSNKK